MAGTSTFNQIAGIWSEMTGSLRGTGVASSERGTPGAVEEICMGQVYPKSFAVVQA